MFIIFYIISGTTWEILNLLCMNMYPVKTTGKKKTFFVDSVISYKIIEGFL
jgi:hypothetical protein